MNKTLLTITLLAATTPLIITCAHTVSLVEHQHAQVSKQLKALTNNPGRKSSKILRRIRRLRQEEAQLWQKRDNATDTAKTDVPAVPAVVKTAAALSAQDVQAIAQTPLYYYAHPPASPPIDYSQEAINDYRMRCYMDSWHGWVHRENVASGDLARRINRLLDQG